MSDFLVRGQSTLGHSTQLGAPQVSLLLDWPVPRTLGRSVSPQTFNLLKVAFDCRLLVHVAVETVEGVLGQAINLGPFGAAPSLVGEFARREGVERCLQALGSHAEGHIVQAFGRQTGHGHLATGEHCQRIVALIIFRLVAIIVVMVGPMERDRVRLHWQRVNNTNQPTRAAQQPTGPN